MAGESATDRRVFEITGRDRIDFLQGLVTSDMARLTDGLVYTALLTPQGKYLADFFLVPRGDTILLDVKDELADGLVQRLSMYRLRADVAIAPSALKVQRGPGAAPDGGFADPRHASLGWRLYSEAEGSAPQIDWDTLRVAACIPETGVELIPGETFILEAGFERMGGVDHRKGCYVGQEVTARMKHKTELRKGLLTVRVEGAAAPGTPIATAEGKAAGTLHTRAGDRGIAYLRFDRANGRLHAGDASILTEVGTIAAGSG